jgi:uncharacterized protein (DUF1684 family)
MSHHSAAKYLACGRALAIIIFALTLSGCSKPQSDTLAPQVFQEPIFQERLAKDQAFKSERNSPILEKDRPAFRRLAYYPVNADLRFSAKLHRYSSPKQMRLGTNTGEIRRGLRYGYFDFKVGDQICKLQVYRLEDASGVGASLFIPFRDSTSGQETYAAGRYIDLKENTSGVYDLDFNRAYNPYCAYNSEFSCPIPPAENTLRVAIRAGEKKYPIGVEH